MSNTPPTTASDGRRWCIIYFSSLSVFAFFHFVCTTCARLDCGTALAVDDDCDAAGSVIFTDKIFIFLCLSVWYLKSARHHLTARVMCLSILLVTTIDINTTECRQLHCDCHFTGVVWCGVVDSIYFRLFFSISCYLSSRRTTRSGNGLGWYSSLWNDSWPGNRLRCEAVIAVSRQ